MNIKLICGYPFPIGLSATNRIITYCKGLVENLDDVQVVIINPTEDKNNVINKENCGIYKGIKFQYVWADTIWPSNYLKKIIVFILSFIKSLSYVYKNNSCSKIDVIISSYDSGVVNLAYYFVSKLITCKLVYIVDEYPSPIRYGRKPFLFRWLSIKYLYTLFDGIIVMTLTLKAYLRNKVRKETKFLVMPITVEPERFLDNRRPSPVKGKYIAYIGELSENKDGVNDLIEAFGLIAPELPDLKLYIIGRTKNESESHHFEELISKYNLEKRILLTGRLHRDLVPAYLNNAVLLALARPDTIRSQGGFPTKLGEYLSTGRPVVCTAVGEIPNYLSDCENAFLVEPNDVRKFADKLQFVLNNLAIAEKVGRAGQKLALDVFNYKVQSKRMHEFLESLF
jgi:glycosyltransferase involved in cell wall biosynthesis